MSKIENAAVDATSLIGDDALKQSVVAAREKTEHRLRAIASFSSCSSGPN